MGRGWRLHNNTLKEVYMFPDPFWMTLMPKQRFISPTVRTTEANRLMTMKGCVHRTGDAACGALTKLGCGFLCEHHDAQVFPKKGRSK